MAKIFKPNNRTKNRKHQSTAKQLANFSGVVQGYDHEGKGIIKQHEGRTVFVPGAMLGEKIKVKPKTYTDKIIHGELLDVEQANVSRIKPKCQHFDVCGGCQLQYMDGQPQIDVKQQALDKLFKHQLKLEEIPWQTPVSGQNWGYRRAARLAVWHEKSKPMTIGFRQKNSNKIVNINDCPILAPDMFKMVQRIRPILESLDNKQAITHLQLFYLQRKSFIILRVTRLLSDSDKQALTTFSEQNKTCVILEPQKQQFENLSAKHFPAEILLEYRLDDLAFQFQPQNFIQINDEVNQLMVKQALDWLELKPEDLVLDLFSGVGNFTLPLAQKVRQVMAVEGVNDMVKRLEHNAAINEIKNVSAHQADLSQIDDKHKPRWLKPIDKLLLDPARDGAYDVVKKIPILAPKQILYVSCNPATMARDVKHLLSANYRLTKIGLLNMFPHTSHVEAMALLEK